MLKIKKHASFFFVFDFLLVSFKQKNIRQRDLGFEGKECNDKREQNYLISTSRKKN